MIIIKVMSDFFYFKSKFIIHKILFIEDFFLFSFSFFVSLFVNFTDGEVLLYLAK